MVQAEVQLVSVTSRGANCASCPRIARLNQDANGHVDRVSIANSKLIDIFAFVVSLWCFFTTNGANTRPKNPRCPHFAMNLSTHRPPED